ncbi:MAG: DUF2924 domain-containing protein [Planctomycetia bacterium]|nr:DUF2924 domain-containing protein [Planctomycetia bacterium]
MNVGKELAALRRMTPAELRDKYAAVFNEASRSGHKAWLIKRIVWRMQANAEGDLSERAKRRALEIACDSDLRLKTPRAPKPVPDAKQRTVTHNVAFGGDKRLPMPGTVISRQYRGQTLQVHVLRDGFEYDGTVHKTLSAVAKAITGTHTNGFLFFRLGQYGGQQ